MLLIEPQSFIVVKRTAFWDGREEGVIDHLGSSGRLSPPSELVECSLQLIKKLGPVKCDMIEWHGPSTIPTASLLMGPESFYAVSTTLENEINNRRARIADHMTPPPPMVGTIIADGGGRLVVYDPEEEEKARIYREMTVATFQEWWVGVGGGGGGIWRQTLSSSCDHKNMNVERGGGR
uniref:Uncharacterized protein n=1 Tax=Timema poppense TaxID=170557 RepID=A0A7R9H5H5_TIMPO|nr:unnamed protein product [Timema poppensis]